MAAGQRKAKGRRKAAETAGPLALTGWVLFDWATQPFYTLVVTFLFAPYFVNGFIKDPALGATLWAYATGGAELVAALLAPILGAIADAGLPRKPWIAGFSVLLVRGALRAVACHSRAKPALAPLVLLSFALATIGAELATVFNNAMMPSLVSGQAARHAVRHRLGDRLCRRPREPRPRRRLHRRRSRHRQDPARSRPDHAGSIRRRGQGDRLVGPFSALWYLIFVLPLFLFTPDRPANARRRAGQGRAGAAHQRREGALPPPPPVALFLLARMLYADGLGAIFAFGGIYAATVFGWGATELGLFGIILTIAGTIGAASAACSTTALGSKRVIAWTLCLFIVASIGVLSVDQDHVLFVHAVEPKVSGQRAVRLHRASRSISPSPFSSASPPARSSRRAARCSRG